MVPIVVLAAMRYNHFMVDANQDYREILREQFESRVRKNPRYSLRAYARDLGVAPSRIVEVLNHKRGLSRMVALRMSSRLGFTEAETQTFLQLVDFAHGRSHAVRSQAASALSEKRGDAFTMAQMDAYKLISEIYHEFIIALSKVHGFDPNPEWIAGRLGIPKVSVVAAVERLRRMELLDLDGRINGDGEDLLRGIAMTAPSAGIKNRHEQALERAQAALYAQTEGDREFGTLTIAVSRQDLPKAYRLLKEFREQFQAEVGHAAQKDSVYCLATQFFRVDQK